MCDENRTSHDWLARKLVTEKLRRWLPDFASSVLDLDMQQAKIFLDSLNVSEFPRFQTIHPSAWRV